MELENQASMNELTGGNDYEQKMQRVVRDYLEQIEQLRNENEELQSKFENLISSDEFFEWRSGYFPPQKAKRNFEVGERFTQS